MRKICVKGLEDKGDTQRGGGEKTNWEDESMIPIPQLWVASRANIGTHVSHRECKPDWSS
jgi:hypothetical protein